MFVCVGGAPKEIDGPVVVLQRFHKTGLCRKRLDILEVAIRERSPGLHGASLCHHVEAMLSGEANWLPHEVDSWYVVCDWLSFDPDWVAVGVKSQSQGSSQDLRKVSIIDAECQTTASKWIIMIKPGLGSLSSLDHFHWLCWFLIL